MSDVEIERIGAEAAAEESAEAAVQADAVPVVNSLPLDEEFADFLDMGAKIAGHGFSLPTIPQRFNHQANLDISKAAIKLCEKYGYDPRSILIGQDSAIGAWLGLVVALGLPSYAVYVDWKAKNAKPVESEASGGGKSSE